MWTTAPLTLRRSLAPRTVLLPRSSMACPAPPGRLMTLPPWAMLIDADANSLFDDFFGESGDDADNASAASEYEHEHG